MVHGMKNIIDYTVITWYDMIVITRLIVVIISECIRHRIIMLHT